MSRKFEFGGDPEDVPSPTPALAADQLISDEDILHGRVRDGHIQVALARLGFEPNNPHRDELMRQEAYRRAKMEFEGNRPKWTIDVIPTSGKMSARFKRALTHERVPYNGCFLGYMRPGSRGLIDLNNVRTNGHGHLRISAGEMVFRVSREFATTMIEIVRGEDGAYYFSLARIKRDWLARFLPIFLDQSPESVALQQEFDEGSPGSLRVYTRSSPDGVPIDHGSSMCVRDIPAGRYGRIMNHHIKQTLDRNGNPIMVIYYEGPSNDEKTYKSVHWPDWREHKSIVGRDKAGQLYVVINPEGL